MLPGLGLLEVVAAEKLRSSPDEGLSVSQLGCAFSDFEDLHGTEPLDLFDRSLFGYCIAMRGETQSVAWRMIEGLRRVSE